MKKVKIGKETYEIDDNYAALVEAIKQLTAEIIRHG